jgi:ADP-heptose:LPS heptosyltransferase
MAKSDPKKIVISRTDSIGDVVLTLPLAGILKEKYPKAKIIFLGNTYTKPIIKCY